MSNRSLALKLSNDLHKDSKWFILFFNIYKTFRQNFVPFNNPSLLECPFCLGVFQSTAAWLCFP